MRKTRGAVAFEGTGAVTPGSRSHGSGTSHSYDQDAGPDRGDPPRDLPTARGNSVGLENDRSIAKAFVARRTVAQFVAVQLKSDRRRPRTGCRRSGDGAAGHRSSHRNQTPQMPLTRLKDSAFDAQVEGVYFGMWNGSIPVRWLVSQEALTDKAEGASLAESLDVFHEYRSEIENLAGVKYDAGQIKSDGLVVVASPDLNPEQIRKQLPSLPPEPRRTTLSPRH